MRRTGWFTASVIVGAWLVCGRPAAAQTDPHAGHERPGPSSTASQPASEALPPDADHAKEALARSPRHKEWVDVPMPDGQKIQTFVVYPERKDRAGLVIVIHEIFGLTDWIRGVADQLAEDGFIALAPDLLSGKAPGGGGSQELGEEAATKVIRTLTPEEVVARLNAVRAYALTIPAGNGKVGVVGYCWGGSQSFLYATAQPALDAAVVYYGSSPSDPAALARIQAPILGLYGGDDARVNATIAPAEAELKKLGKRFTYHIYDGAGHGFLRQQTGREGANRRATEQAWPATLAFFREHLK
jgi:carboxymethylenebutenolidase